MVTCDSQPAKTLHYTARAGLLSELSRQTYDSLYKALREAILNGIDAGASRVKLDFGSDHARDEVVLADDGEGMDIDGVRSAFMSLGGSAKYDDDTKFGRIGIGSLALLTYGTEAVIETKRAGDPTIVEASLYHPQTLDRDQRAQALDDFPAGLAVERKYDGSAQDHFTCIRLRGLTPEVQTVSADPVAFYELLDQLRRVLPLPLGDSRLLDALAARDPELVSLLRSHADDWSVPVTVGASFHAPFELKRRTYGDGDDEVWSGQLRPIYKKLKVVREGESREVIAAGFFGNQRRATPSWSGLTARVQNVAVEEQTFFDVEADPGFRKYITGEIFLLGDVDTDRLININRTSFNRESRDYAVVRRFVASELEQFKRRQVADSQRQKVVLRRSVERYRSLLKSVQDVISSASEILGQDQRKGLPSSKNGSLSAAPEVDPVKHLRSLGASVVVRTTKIPSSGYRIEMPEDREKLRLYLSPEIAKPCLSVGGVQYKVSFRRGTASGPPVIVKNRPREIVFNTGHPAVGDQYSGNKAAMALALELAYVLPRNGDADGLYDQVLGFLSGM
jgi:hypothetical protein